MGSRLPGGTPRRPGRRGRYPRPRHRRRPGRPSGRHAPAVPDAGPGPCHPPRRRGPAHRRGHHPPGDGRPHRPVRTHRKEQPMTRSLAGRTIVMSGGSRGIGLAVALRAARDGANLVLLAKTAEPHPKLQGTIYEAAEQIEAAGGKALPVVGDVRSDESIAEAVAAAVETFGGIDICLNNASVLQMQGTLDLPPSRYDLMQDINVRGTFMLSRACLPHLLDSTNPHILTLSPPLNLTSKYWLRRFPGYMLSKYGMSLITLALAAEFEEQGVAVNSL